MADTATTASAAAASPANASTDAPPFQLGKPRFQQVRPGLRLADGRREAQGRGSSQVSCKVTSARRVSNPRPPAPTASAGTSAVAVLFPLVNWIGKVSHLGFLLAGGAVTPRLPAPCHRPRPRRAVIGHAGRGSRVRAALKGRSGKSASGAKFPSCAALVGSVAETLLNFSPNGTGLPCELRDSRGAKLPDHTPRSRSGSSTSSWVLRAPQDGTTCMGAATRSLSPGRDFSYETCRPASGLCGDAAGTRERAGCGETLCHPPEPPHSSRGSHARPSLALGAPWRCAALAPIHIPLGSSECTVTVVSLAPGHKPKNPARHH